MRDQCIIEPVALTVDTYCQFIDDGHASFDLREALVEDWPYHEAQYGRTSRAYVDHPEHGSLFINVTRDFRATFLQE